MQRLARAHANCIEGLPIFGGLLAIAIMTLRTARAARCNQRPRGDF
jgi:hypothetical protein